MNLYEKAQSGSLTKVLGIDALELRRLRNNRGGKLFLIWLQFEKLTQKGDTGSCDFVVCTGKDSS